MNFANPHILYLLAAVPLIALFYLLARYARRRKLRRFGRPEVISGLMPNASQYMPGIKMILALTALALLIVAAARPYVKTDKNVKRDTEESKVEGIEVMVCFDVSNSMLASSTTAANGTSRLQRAKFILEKALDDMNDDRVGIIAFAGDASTIQPLSPDIRNAKMKIKELSTGIATVQGTAIGAAIDIALNSFDPESGFQKTIIVITDGENFEDDAIEAARKAKDAGVEVNVIGVGTSTPMPIPLRGQPGQFMTHNGEEVRTALNEDEAAEIAKAGGGIYIAGSSSSAVDELKVQLDKIEKTEYVRTAIPSDSSDLFPLFTGLALILLIIEVMLPYSKLAWLRNIKFFSK